MPRDERFKKASAAGADFLDTARAKAEEFLRELAKAGGDTQKQAQDTIDELVGGGRRSTEQFVASIRKEITNQLHAVGLATKDDLAALERRLTGRVSAAESSAARSSAESRAARSTARGAARKAATAATAASEAAEGAAGTARAASSRKAAPAKKSTSARQGAPTRKTAAKKSTAAKKASGAKKAAPGPSAG